MRVQSPPLWEQSGKSAPFIGVHSEKRTYTAILRAAETGVAASKSPSPIGRPLVVFPQF